MPLPDVHAWDFDIDHFLNRFVPYPRWHLIPYPVAHLLGHREHLPKKPGNILVTLWAVVGVFCGLSIVAAVTMHVPIFQERVPIIIIASFGAAAVLEFCAIDSPFAQPRNAFFGQLFAAVVGVGITKLFAMNPHADSIYWISGSVACAVVVGIMSLTKTVHPPAGATALLASIHGETRLLGWVLVPMVVLGSALILATALLINNIQRRFPVYWWTPESLKPEPAEKDPEMSSSDDDRPPTESELKRQITEVTEEFALTVHRGRVTVPDGLFLTAEELEFLDELSHRM
ncbi:hypothetical protein FQN55_002461 [Onygenales sp. PD_40]|nr:hypothetical protein FQN55_002461 [Onygenales sp. PD_40]KAK2782978.1 hypothetical protein FQN53_009390 [Emmonsiellopsis sp. PD_33]KAK2786414.1 hypothetical protein FQN51_003601 [Onygenales sp. PD_10]KAK2786509.1 hypothetical protein FQN52_007815 [Onygenales sp. PD_12]